MPQIQFPFFPEGVTHITALLAFARRDGRVTYFNGNMPVFFHDETDLASFRMITAQFVVNGHATQAEIARAFGVAKISIKRAVKLYREQGPKGFYAPRNTRGAAVLTPSVLEQAQQLFDEGLHTPEVADRLGIKRDTLSKAVRAGRLHARTPRQRQRGVGDDEQERAHAPRQWCADGHGGLEYRGAAGRQCGRIGCGGPDFVPALDVPYGGVLFALPALLALGLIDSTPGLLRTAQGLLRAGQRAGAARLHGAGAAEVDGAAALLRPRRVGQAAGTGSCAGGAHAARQDPPAGRCGPSRAMECGAVPALDAGGPRAGRHPLRRRACARV